MSDWNWLPPDPLAAAAPEPLAAPPPPPPRWPRRAALGAAGLCALMLAGVVGGVVGANLAEDGPAPALAARPVVIPENGSAGDLSRPTGSGTDVRAVLAKVEPSVVAISVRGGNGGGQG